MVLAINELAALNPTLQPAYSSHMTGDWVLISAPVFTGRITPLPGQEMEYQYTLGQMSFDLFEPNGLVCTVNTVINPVDIIPDNESNNVGIKK